MYNIYLKDTGILSVSAYEKKWRFNRDLKGMVHPTSVILAEYDPETKEVKKVYSNFSCDNDTEIAVKVNGGYYILWVYKPADLAKNKKPDFLKIRIASDEDLSVKYVGPDQEFLAISDIVARYSRYANKSKIKKEEFFYDIQNSLDKSGIAYRVVLNDTSDLYEEWDNDASSVEGIQLLPPYNKSKKFLFRVGPDSYVTVLGIQKEEYGTHWFNLKSKISQMPVDSLKEEIHNNLVNPNAIYTTDFDNMVQPEYITTSYDVALEQSKFPPGKNNKNVHMNKLKSNYSRLMNTFSKTFPSEMKNSKLVPTEIKKGDVSFFGESNPKAKEGRGLFYDAKNDMILVTTWRDQDESTFGQIYNNLGNLLYEGEMINGVAHGKGTFFFPGGEKYYGNFENGVIEGNGIFYWDDGCRWEGTFSNNKLHGDGVFFNPKSKTSFNATYKNNRLIEEGGNNSVFNSLRKKDRRERGSYGEKDRDRDSYKEKEERETTGGMGSRRMLFRGRGKGREKRERGADRVAERLAERDADLEREIEKEMDIEKDLDNNPDRELVEREIEIETDDKNFNINTNKLGNALLRSGEAGKVVRYKKKEVYREKNQREFEREKPKDERESEEENNEEESERESEKDEDQNANREARKFGRSNRGKARNNRKERNRNKKESDEDESDE
jgi:hypothetical protein